MSAPPPAETRSRPSARPRRLTRRRRGRMIGGVALGFAAYLGIDVVVVRVLFVVATFIPFGLGPLVYLAALLLMPVEGEGERAGSEGDEVPRAAGRGARFYVGLVLVAVAASWLLGAMGMVGGWGTRGPGPLVPLLLIGLGVALWVDADRRGEATRAPAAPGVPNGPPAAPGVPSAPPVGSTATSPPAVDAGGSRAPQPADTVPLRAATTEGTAEAVVDAGAGTAPPPPPPAPPDQPSPPPARPAARRPGAGATRLVLALALLVGGSVWLLQQTGALDVDPVALLAWPALVLGLGLVVASFRGRATTLAVLSLLLIPVLLAGLVLRGLDLPLGAGAGERVVVLAEGDELPEVLELAAGTFTVDLGELRTSPDQPLRIRLAAGEIRVIVPADAGVRGTVRTEAGELQLLGTTASGMGVERVVDVPATGDGPTITIDVQLGVGAVKLVRPGDARSWGWHRGAMGGARDGVVVITDGITREDDR